MTLARIASAFHNHAIIQIEMQTKIEFLKTIEFFYGIKKYAIM